MVEGVLLKTSIIFQNAKTVFVVLLWATGAVSGLVIMWNYSSVEGSATEAPVVWPESSGLHRALDRYTLVMFVHPRCPCSVASLTNLSNLLNNRIPRRVASIVVFNTDGVAPDRVEDMLRSIASTLPDTVVVDDTGHEEALFGVRTSGATMLFDSAGVQLFTGGLTAVRGHAGDSSGQELITDLVLAGTTVHAESPVFGCSLEDTEETR